MQLAEVGHDPDPGCSQAGRSLLDREATRDGAGTRDRFVRAGLADELLTDPIAGLRAVGDCPPSGEVSRRGW